MFLFSSNSNSLDRVNNNQSKFILERIAKIEKHFSRLCTTFGSYTRRKAKLRDTGDELSKELLDYGETEHLNKTTRQALIETANSVSSVQDYRNLAVEHLSIHVVRELSLYGSNCRKAKEQLKRSFETRQQEINHRQNLERARDCHPHNRQQISIAESKLQKSTHSAIEACTTLEEQMDEFELKKIQDLKRILMEFVQTELAFHVKAVELFTQTYNDIASIQEEDDLEAFRNARDVFDSEFRNALCSNITGRAGIVEAEATQSLTPVITSKRSGVRNSKRERDLAKSVEKLDVEDYEEIQTVDSSSEDD
ncbi:unnamed protein product [Meganyctiphanes norvegica]|uniref:Protein FAM92A n=1 Tax=Meganyctiphanes norvegica TaxID=48144 RepID=A0AAV2R8U3_MEGNR